MSQDYARDYVELVLYPELFISWVGRMRRCKQMVRRGRRGWENNLDICRRLTDSSRLWGRWCPRRSWTGWRRSG